jgi:hypothetical protein
MLYYKETENKINERKMNGQQGRRTDIIKWALLSKSVIDT